MAQDEIRSIIRGQMQPPLVVPVNAVTDLDGGAQRIVTSVEVWSWRVVVRWTESYPPGSREWPPGRPSSSELLRPWVLSDDAGGEYRSVGHGGGGDAVWHEGYVRFDGVLPAQARALILEAPDGASVHIPVRPATS